MHVEFHCGKCGKLIRAPRESSGKRGKCPYCKQSVYIPSPPDVTEEIPLAPIDEEAEPLHEELDEEAERLIASLGQADDGAGNTGSRTAAGPSGGDLADVPRMVVHALLAMHESRLDEADQIIRRLNRHGEKAKAHIQSLMVDALPPAELEDCPPPLYKGFLREILERL